MSPRKETPMCSKKCCTLYNKWSQYKDMDLMRNLYEREVKKIKRKRNETPTCTKRCCNPYKKIDYETIKRTYKRTYKQPRPTEYKTDCIMSTKEEIKKNIENISIWLDIQKENAIEFVFSEEYDLEDVKEQLEESMGLIPSRLIWCFAKECIKNATLLYELTDCKELDPNETYCKKWAICICYDSYIQYISRNL